jgi:hypothetical protein
LEENADRIIDPLPRSHIQFPESSYYFGEYFRIVAMRFTFHEYLLNVREPIVLTTGG